MVYPGRFVFPTCGELQRIVRFPGRVRSLDVPDVLQNKRVIFLLVFVPDDVSRVGRWDVQDLHAHVRNQFAALHRGHRDLRSVLFFYLVIFSLCRDAPCVQIRDSRACVKRNKDRSQIAPSGSNNLVRLAHQCLDLVRRLHGGDSFRIHLHRVGLFVVGRNGCIPVRSSTRARPLPPKA